jgi:ribosomal protein L40E
MIDTLNLAARKKLGVGDDWQWCESEAITGGFLLTGSKTTIGPRSGRPKWIRPMEKVLIADADLREAEKSWEAEHGKCFRCEGTKQELFGWSKADGNKYRPCTRCGATGNPPEATA